MGWTRIASRTGLVASAVLILTSLTLGVTHLRAGEDAPPSTPVVGLYLDWENHANACSDDTPAHDVVVVQWFWAAQGEHGCSVSDIRERNPDARVLAYQNIAGMTERPSPHPSTPVSCVTRDEASAREAAGDSSFYLHPRAGHAAATEIIGGIVRIVFEQFPEVAAADVADPDYLRACAARLPAIAEAGFDGVFLDDVNTWPGHGWGQHAGPQPDQPGAALEHPTDAAYGAAMVALVRRLSAAAHDVGLETAGNIGINPWMPELRRLNERMLATTDPAGGAPLDAQFREFWMCWNSCAAPLSDSEWAWNAYLMQQAGDAGRDFWTQTGRGEGGHQASGVDDGVVEYSQASWWLMWDGRPGSAWGFWDNRPSVRPHMSPDIGTPVEPAPVVADEQPQNRYTCLSDCRFTREYTDGVVVVNAGSAGSHTFELGGSFRRGDTGRVVERVTLGPAEGMTLTRD